MAKSKGIQAPSDVRIINVVFNIPDGDLDCLYIYNSIEKVIFPPVVSKFTGTPTVRPEKFEQYAFHASGELPLPIKLTLELDCDFEPKPKASVTNAEVKAIVGIALILTGKEAPKSTEVVLQQTPTVPALTSW